MPTELELAAVFAYVNNLAPPADACAWSGFAEQLLQFRGYTSVLELTEPCDRFLLFVVAASQEPRVVTETCALLCGMQPTTATVDEWDA